MSASNCSNCASPLDPAFKHCPNCGQSTAIHRFNVKHLIHEFLHAFTHTDKGALVLLRDLAIRPSTVLREYIIEGKRKKYFNPFTLLLLVLGVTVFMSSVFHPMRGAESIYKEQIASANTQKKKALMISMAEKQERLSQLVEKKMNVVVFITAPLMALAFWLVFKGKGQNYAEHLVAYLMLTCLLSLVSSICLLPLMAILPPENMLWISLANILIQMVYTCYAYKGFLKLKGFGDMFMVVVANILGMIFWFTVLMIAMLVFIIFL
ncbi:DUF3667 domain-containing protein [Sediminibacterium sp. KACHI17]|jgi:hypothetical protein|uniref:DUF3667 domain-containing protein n=1 Tax=Sediminibacterium sp. KACHI17 TaxID=1751071 RepID=UPI00336538D7